MTNYTPTSGIAWTANPPAYTYGGWSGGMECTPSGPDGGEGSATAVHIENIPFSITGLEIINGTFTMQGNAKAACLLRVAVIGDPSLGDGGLASGAVLLLNMVLNVAGGQPCTVALPPIQFDNIQKYIPVPRNGGPYQLMISMQFAGAQWPMDAELEFAGRWTAE